MPDLRDLVGDLKDRRSRIFRGTALPKDRDNRVIQSAVGQHSLDAREAVLGELTRWIDLLEDGAYGKTNTES